MDDDGNWLPWDQVKWGYALLSWLVALGIMSVTWGLITWTLVLRDLICYFAFGIPLR